MANALAAPFGFRYSLRFMPQSLALRKTPVNSPPQIYDFSQLLSNPIMDIDDVRRQNILALEKSFGSPKALADAVEMTYTQYVNLRDGAKDARSGKRRGMRKETAWRFEDAGALPRGWLDRDHGASEQPGSDGRASHVVHEPAANYTLTRDYLIDALITDLSAHSFADLRETLLEIEFRALRAQRGKHTAHFPTGERRVFPVDKDRRGSPVLFREMIGEGIGPDGAPLVKDHTDEEE